MKLKNHLIITQDSDRKIIFGDLIIKKNKISKIISKKMINSPEGIVLPGLINCHVHLGELYFRGFFPRLTLDKYLKSTEKMNEEGKLDTTRENITPLTLSEMISTGTTYFIGARIDQSLKKLGLDGLSLYPIMLSKKLKNYYLKFNKDILRNYHGVFIHSLLQIQVEKLMELSETNYKGYLSIHVAETLSSSKKIFEQYKMSEIELLDKYNLLNEKTLLVHCNYCSVKDFEIIKKRKAIIIHCPVSNKRIISKKLPLDDLLKNRIKVVISTDGPATNDSLDLFQEAKFAFLNNKTINCQKLLDMVTILPANYLKLNSLGSIEKGKIANLITFKYSSHFYPLNNIVNNLILNPGTASIKEVIINGQVEYFAKSNFKKEKLIVNLQKKIDKVWPIKKLY